MKIKEFYYINSRRQQVGPVAFTKENVMRLTPDTFVWHAGMTDGWHKAGEVREFAEIAETGSSAAPVPPPFEMPEQQVEIPEKSSVEPRQTPAAPAAGQATGAGHAPASKPAVKQKKKGYRWVILIAVTLFALIPVAALAFFLMPPIASMISTAPTYVGFAFGGVTLIVAIIIGLLCRSKFYIIGFSVAGLIVGAVFPTINAIRFETDCYEDGLLITYNGVYNGVYNSIGEKILSVGYGDNGINRVSGPGGIKLLKITTDDNASEYNEDNNHRIYIIRKTKR